jgi:hypothetical protein
MATTKDRIEQLESLWTEPTPAGQAPEAPVAAPAAPPARRPLARDAATVAARLVARVRALRLGGRMAPGTALALGLGWVAAVVIVPKILPAPPPARVGPDPALVVALNQLWSLAFYGALAGAAVRRRWGLAVSAVGAVTALGLAIACPVSGHHDSVGLWWAAELVAFGGLSAFSLRGLLRR